MRQLDAPTIGKLITHPTVDDVKRRRLEYAILGEWPRTD